MHIWCRYIKIMFIAALTLCTGCSNPVSPDNFEPIIEMLPATDITRTEAVVSARIQIRGSKLSYISFHYGESGKIDSEVSVTDLDSELLTLKLEKLKPGTSYSCYVEGRTATAVLRSETVSFTTVPNDLPKVSAAVPLSTGPIAIIVSFDIVDDGGEPLLEAGCELMNYATKETKRFYLPSQELKEGRQRLTIGGLALLNRYIITPFASNSAGEAVGEALDYTTGNSIMLEDAGSLAALLDNGKDLRLEHLTITGSMNGDDFRFLRLMLGAPSQTDPIESSVTSVDLSDVKIVEGGGPYDGGRFTVADELSTGIFADCKSLQNILLPITATKMARDAFANCPSLKKLLIPAEVGELLPSTGCTSLEAIEVSPANQYYMSFDGVLFNAAGSEILWFPIGKMGEFHLPETITTIGENAFFGTNITTLYIPSTVTAISRGAFAGSALTDISLPDNLTNVSEGMFQNCTNLSTVHLGKSTEYVGNYVFDGTAIKNLYVGAAIPPFAADEAFVNGAGSITDACVLHVPTGSKAVYRNNSKWGRFYKIEEF